MNDIGNAHFLHKRGRDDVGGGMLIPISRKFPG